MKSKGFTLIELLVVVAIIGILAAVGVVAYNGYTKSAKINIVKSNHKQAVKVIQLGLSMCEIGDQLNGWNSSKKKCELIDCDRNPAHFATNMHKAFACLSEDNDGQKNPFDSNDHEGGFHMSDKVPEIKHVGRTACNHDGNSPGQINCNSRWGTGNNEYITTIIKNPY